MRSKQALSSADKPMFKEGAAALSGAAVKTYCTLISHRRLCAARSAHINMLNFFANMEQNK
jgi:hypothetical protein